MEIDLSSIMSAGGASPEDTNQEYMPPDDIEMPPYDDTDFAEEDPPEEMFGQDRRRLILLLQLYLNEFPHKLSTYKHTDLEKLKKSELEKLKEEVEYCLGTKQNLNVAVSGIIMGINMFEQVAVNFTPLKISGLSQVCNEREVLDDIKCVAIKHLDMVKVEPEARLCMRLFSTALQLHTINSIQTSNDTLNKPPPTVVEVNDTKFDVL